MVLAVGACGGSGVGPRGRVGPAGPADPAAMRALLARYSPSGHAIVTAYEALPTRFELPEGAYEVTSPDTFDGYFRDGAVENVVTYMTTAVHETTHGYIGTMAFQLLAERGLIRRLDGTGSKRRYDGDTDAHYHVRCERCGRVDDVHTPPIKVPRRAAARASGYRITGHRLELTGLCPTCRDKGRRGRR